MVFVRKILKSYPPKTFNKMTLLDHKLVVGLLFKLFLWNLPCTSFARISIVSEDSNDTIAYIADLPARFIPERFSFYGIQGYLVYSNPPSACQPVDLPPNIYPPNPDYPIHWILLARRSHRKDPDACDFQSKIENAQNAGYTAIIIHNVGSNLTDAMGVEDPSKLIIYATFVGEYDGVILSNYTYTSNNQSHYFIRIQDDFSINGYVLPFAIVVGLCFTTMIFFMLWQQVTRWIRERRRSRRRKLPQSALKKIPISKWTKGDPYETCAICLEDFVENDKIRVLPCCHGFHVKCIDPWLTKGRRVCPICKRKVVVADERFRDSDTDTEDESAPLLGTSGASSSENPVSGEGTFIQTQENQNDRSRRSGGVRSGANDSDSSSMTSVSSGQSTCSRNEPVSPSHRSVSVLAEIHHTSEVLKKRIGEIEQQKQETANTFTSFNDNAVYVPEVEFENPNVISLQSESSPISSQQVPPTFVPTHSQSHSCLEGDRPSPQSHVGTKNNISSSIVTSDNPTV